MIDDFYKQLREQLGDGWETVDEKPEGFKPGELYASVGFPSSEGPTGKRTDHDHEWRQASDSDGFGMGLVSCACGAYVAFRYTFTEDGDLVTMGDVKHPDGSMEKEVEIQRRPMQGGT